MARQGRRTEPLETRSGVLHDYAAIEALLSAGEMKGRQWVFERAVAVPRTSPTDHDILDLHVAMFGDFLPWAGATRLDDRGPGGKVPVPWNEVRIALRSFAEDLARWVVAVERAELANVASVVADAHHRERNGAQGSATAGADEARVILASPRTATTLASSEAPARPPSAREQESLLEVRPRALALGRPLGPRGTVAPEAWRCSRE